MGKHDGEVTLSTAFIVTLANQAGIILGQKYDTGRELNRKALKTVYREFIQVRMHDGNSVALAGSSMRLGSGSLHAHAWVHDGNVLLPSSAMHAPCHPRAPSRG